jgi:signal transduction histidine kinase
MVNGLNVNQFKIPIIKISKSPRLRLAILYSSVMGCILLGLGYATHRVLARISSQMIDREIDLLSMSMNARLEQSLQVPNVLPPAIDRLIVGICKLNVPCQPEIQDSLLLNLIREDYHLQLLNTQGKALAAIGEPPGRFPVLSDFSSLHTVKDPQGRPYHLHHKLLKTSQGQNWGYLQVGRSVQQYDHYMMNLHWLINVGIPAAMLVVGGVSWYLAGVAMRPIYASYEQMQRFTGDVSHELRTPIASLKAILEVALHPLNQTPELTSQTAPQPPILGEQETHATFLALQRQTDRMSELVQDLLLLSQLDLVQPGKTQTNPQQSICLNELVQDLEEELAPLALAAQVDINCHIHHSQPLYIRGNPNQLYRVFSNLITNAIQYSPPRTSVQIHLTSRPKSVTIAIQDQGIGIAEADILHLFDRFYRVRQDRSRQTGGVGLGLSIVKAIVEDHGGQIDVTSQLGQGSTFTVRFPLCR